MEFATFYLAGEEEKEKASRGVREVLRIMGVCRAGGTCGQFYEHPYLELLKSKVLERIGFNDLAIGVIATSFGVVEEIVGVKVLEEHEFPRIHNWIKNFKQNLTIKNNLPDPHRMFLSLRPV
ncbi:glutathione S-transferase U7-like [Humulus lupulus]|uniref:glutathione S-transferase U7-like n=1 Tax=Humulus lupulus TaxID=3486 RepID=UPI002B407B7D|nr:glutathione S-transferase U7-like [Humulus lupulus]